MSARTGACRVIQSLSSIANWPYRPENRDREHGIALVRPIFTPWLNPGIAPIIVPNAHAMNEATATAATAAGSRPPSGTSHT